jgi:hypothetical protein
MDLTDNGIWILGILAVVALMALAVWLRSRRKPPAYQLEQGFGPEYGHAPNERSSRTDRP